MRRRQRWEAQDRAFERAHWTSHLPTTGGTAPVTQRHHERTVPRRAAVVHEDGIGFFGHAEAGLFGIAVTARHSGGAQFSDLTHRCTGGSALRLSSFRGCRRVRPMASLKSRHVAAVTSAKLIGQPDCVHGGRSKGPYTWPKFRCLRRVRLSGHCQGIVEDGTAHGPRRASSFGKRAFSIAFASPSAATGAAAEPLCFRRSGHNPRPPEGRQRPAGSWQLPPSER